MVLARGFVIGDGAPGGALGNRNLHLPLQGGAMPQPYLRGGNPTDQLQLNRSPLHPLMQINDGRASRQYQ
jgi:hypothetical protein